ncbi:helix-turn-helix domain-containing protein [Sphaerisporangium fuscum]|uniref:helix-turn-helix domain-containing protein n=1 Tax=Sphaerisporangium fuscum TaxID=2835868 RepID=UPI001BDC126D|nr:helix-turn-helix transcriptional regulator [Sphaerisporangium fuscum]
MPPNRERDPYESPLAQFAFELQRLRQAAKLTQRQLGARLKYSDSMVNMVEQAKRPPSEDFAKLCDQVFGLDGVMTRLYLGIVRNRAPQYLLSWLDEEARAHCLRTWQPMVIPGLLQTEAYARAVLASWPGITDEELEEKLTNRLQRQAILHRENPPVFHVILDEDVIRHPVGSPEIMREQLRYLLEIAQLPNVTIQIVPYEARPHCGLQGGFIIAERNNHVYAAYVDVQPVGRTLDDPQVLMELLRRYDAIRAEAVPFKQSLRLIEEAVNHIDT